MQGTGQYYGVSPFCDNLKNFKENMRYYDWIYAPEGYDEWMLKTLSTTACI